MVDLKRPDPATTAVSGQGAAQSVVQRDRAEAKRRSYGEPKVPEKGYAHLRAAAESGRHRMIVGARARQASDARAKLAIQKDGKPLMELLSPMTRRHLDRVGETIKENFGATVSKCMKACIAEVLLRDRGKIA